VRAPDRFAGLVLTNAVCYDSWPIPSVKLMQRLAPVLARLPEVAVYPTIVQLLHRGHDAPDTAREAIGVHWAPYVAHGAARALMRQVRPLDPADTLAVADRLPTLGLPARVVWGETDQFQKVAYGERLAQDLRTELVRIAGGKHFTPEDHPQIVAEAVNELLGA
jgi:pimeloyl-ACP methyl ester carboxylesterase